MPAVMPLFGTMQDLSLRWRASRNRNFSRVDWMAGIGLRWMHATSIIEAVHVTSHYSNLTSLSFALLRRGVRERLRRGGKLPLSLNSFRDDSLHL